MAMPMGRDGFGKARVLDDAGIPLTNSPLDGARAMVENGLDRREPTLRPFCVQSIVLPTPAFHMPEKAQGDPKHRTAFCRTVRLVTTSPEYPALSIGV